MTLNSPEVLRATRTKYRVPQPNVAKHSLIRALRAAAGIPVYYHNRHHDILDNGSSPTSTVYDQGALYVQRQATKERNCLIHELCHAVVAKKRQRLGKTNFGLDPLKYEDRDEIHTCRMEFYMGFMSGYYSWEQLGEYIFDYSFANNLDWLNDEDIEGRKLELLDSMSRESVIKFLLECRRIALLYPGAQEAMRRIGVSTSKGAVKSAVRRASRA